MLKLPCLCPVTFSQAGYASVLPMHMTAGRSETGYTGLDGSQYAGLQGSHTTYGSLEDVGDIEV